MFIIVETSGSYASTFSITHFIAFFNPHGLIHLLVCAYPQPHRIRTRELHLTNHRGATFSELVGQNSSTLQDITLLNAWQDAREHSRKTAPSWIPDIPFQQLYISKPSKWSGPVIPTRPDLLEGPLWRLKVKSFAENLT